MTKRVFWACALALCAACDDIGIPSGAQQLQTPQRIAGTGDLSEPSFASTGGSFLTVTDSGQPDLVFIVTATSLEVQPLSFRSPPPGAPETPTAFGEIARDAFVVPNDDSGGGSVAGTMGFAAFLSQASNLLEPGSGIAFFRDATQAFVKDVATGANYLASVGEDGLPANANVTSAVISGGGRFVAFATGATNVFVPENTQLAPNGASQIYVVDLVTGEVDLISKTSGNAPGTNDSFDPAITPDGRFVAFSTFAANLVAGDTNLSSDILLYDRSKLTMTRVSVDPGNVETYGGARDPVLSQNGNFVAFTATIGGSNREVFLRNVSTGVVTAVSGGANADCVQPAITPDGRFVAFESAANNLVPGDVGGFSDVFVFDSSTATLLRASVDAAGNGGNGDSGDPTLSADGNFIAYISFATNVALPSAIRPDSNPNGLANLILAVQPFGNP
jgi:hypothetical protein